MDASTFVAAFCATLSLILAQSATDAEHQQMSDHLQLVDHHFKFRYSVPRKLKLEEQPIAFKILADKEVVPHKKNLIKASSDQQINRVDEKPQENVMMHATKGTRREWVEDPNKSEYFSMDYHWVRRRRPIHNKQIPFLPIHNKQIPFLP